MRRRAFLTAFLTALAGCAATEDSDVEGKQIAEVRHADVHRFIDHEAGVVVYVGTTFDTGCGVATVPIEDTDL